MAKYRFRLEVLQKVRQIQRNEDRARLADAYRAEEVLDAQRVELTKQLAELRDLQRTATSGPQFDINTLAAAGRYEPVLKGQQQVLDDQKKLLDEETERRRQALLESDRSVRALELLDQRRREEFHRRQMRTEAKQLDEVASVQTWRKQANDS